MTLRRARIAVTAVLTAVVTPLLLAQSRTTSSHLVLGALRHDGILLPFAAFDGRKWSTPWPGLVDSFSPDLPVSVSSVPRSWWGGHEPGAWQVWPLDGMTPRPFKLLTPSMARVGIVRQLGFRTDHPPVLPPVPPFELPFPKVGLAIAGDATLEPISRVSELGPTWRTFAESLRADINKAEEQTLKAIRTRSNWVHPVKQDARVRLPAELEAWYVTALPEPEARLSYFEAIKKYPLTPEDQGCGLETFVSGWVFHGGREKPQSTLKAVVGYCDRRGVSYMLPFGSLSLGGRLHWVVQMSGRDHEWYAVVESHNRRVKYVAQYQAGRAAIDR